MSGIDSYGELEVPEEKTEVKVDIKQGVSLSFILEKMHSDESRINFLEKKIEVYEKIGDYEKASQTAKELGNQELADVYALMEKMVKENKG